jgi:hypothetical protein
MNASDAKKVRGSGVHRFVPVDDPAWDEAHGRARAAERTALGPRTVGTDGHISDKTLAELLPQLVDGAGSDVAEAALRAIAQELEDMQWIKWEDEGDGDPIDRINERLSAIQSRAEAAAELHARIRRAHAPEIKVVLP